MGWLGRWWRKESKYEEGVRRLDLAMTSAMADTIVSDLGGYIARRQARYGRMADLPHPKLLIEMAFLKTMRDSLDPERVTAVEAVYVTLDDYMLNEDDYAALTKGQTFLGQGRESLRALSAKESVQLTLNAGGPGRAVELMEQLRKKSNGRAVTIDLLRRKLRRSK